MKNREKSGSVAEWSIAADCKSADFGLRGFESLPAHKIELEEQAVVAQSVEHFHGKEKVSGPIPDNGSGVFLNN